MELFKNISMERCLYSLQYMWKGMLCIFVVILVIILAVYGMNFVITKLEEKKKQKEETNE